MHTLVCPPGHEGLGSSSVWCERLLEISLDGANVWLPGIAMEASAVICDVKTVRRHRSAVS
jgi:hypothetical protein